MAAKSASRFFQNHRIAMLNTPYCPVPQALVENLEMTIPEKPLWTSFGGGNV